MLQGLLKVIEIREKASEVQKSFGPVSCARLGSGQLTGTAAGNAPGAPENLKINLLEKPYGVPKEDLRFSWSFTDRDQNEKQTAYRIVIGETASDMQAGSYLIDTGWVREQRQHRRADRVRTASG